MICPVHIHHSACSYFCAMLIPLFPCYSDADTAPFPQLNLWILTGPQGPSTGHALTPSHDQIFSQILPNLCHCPVVPHDANDALTVRENNQCWHGFEFRNVILWCIKSANDK